MTVKTVIQKLFRETMVMCCISLYISKLARLTPCGLKEITLYILNKNLTVLIKRIILWRN